MSIRRHDKDHLKQLAEPVTRLPTVAASPESDDPLRFWTMHEKSVLIDLTVFRDGQMQPPRLGNNWAGAFTGRPALIAQLAPVVRTVVEYLAPDSAGHCIRAIRAWWRLFDAVEAASDAAGTPMRVQEIGDITDLHRQRAFDDGMGWMNFQFFLRILNLALQTQQRRQLYWTAPERPVPKRHLPPSWQVDAIRFGLKHAWFAALRRWERAEQLLKGQKPLNEEERRLRKNYRRFSQVARMGNNPRPSSVPLNGNVPRYTFTERGYSIADMVRGFYPDAYDIRVAFHLCLANTGWNGSVLLDLHVDDEFIEPHPKDPTRYLLRGKKNRGRSEHVTEGLFKSQGSAGVILQTVMTRTQPLRAQLRKDLAGFKKRYKKLHDAGAGDTELADCWKQIVALEQGVRSPWLYLTSAQTTVQWLGSAKDYSAGFTREVRGRFLAEFIVALNKKQAPDRQLSIIIASDFRDAFAEYAYRVSGGFLLYVMKVLRHKQPRTTLGYLDNTLVNAQSERMYRTFSESLWAEIKVYGRVDPTILAKRARDGHVTDGERRRLDDYRTLRRSRIGVGCKNPTKPPKHIAPDFEFNGQSMCPVQRCTLCIENAVIFPNSLAGLAKRMAELRYIKSNVSAVAFMESSFGEEIENTEFALAHFDQQRVGSLIAECERRIAAGEHRVIDLDGIQRAAS
jgi:hypothetical protein